MGGGVAGGGGDIKVRACLFLVAFSQLKESTEEGHFKFQRLGKETHVKGGKECRMMETAGGTETSGTIAERSISNEILNLLQAFFPGITSVDSYGPDASKTVFSYSKLANPPLRAGSSKNNNHVQGSSTLTNTRTLISVPALVVT